MKEVLTVQIVDLKQEDEFFIRTLSREPLHRVHKFGHRHGAVSVPVKDSKSSLHEKRLQKYMYMY